MYQDKTYMGYAPSPSMGTNGLTVMTGGEPTLMEKYKAWAEKTGPLDVKNQWWALGGAAVLVGGVAYLVASRR